MVIVGRGAIFHDRVDFILGNALLLCGVLPSSHEDISIAVNADKITLN